MEEAIIAAVVAVSSLLSVAAIGGRALFRRMNSLEEESEQYQQAVVKERDELLKRVADLEEKAKRVPALERQLDTVCAQLTDVQSRLEKSEALSESKQQEIDRLEREKAQLTSELKAQLDENAGLRVQVSTYEKALALLGVERLEAKQANHAEAGGEGAQEVPQEKED